MANGEILGLHHVKLPVAELERSRTWYERVFELEPNIEFPDATGVVRGVSYRAKRGFTLALRENPDLAHAMIGFDPIAILIESREDIDAWAQRLNDLGIDHAPVCAGAIGWLLSFADPDGLQLKLYTSEQHGSPRKSRQSRDQARAETGTTSTP